MSGDLVTQNLLHLALMVTSFRDCPPGPGTEDLSVLALMPSPGTHTGCLLLGSCLKEKIDHSNQVSQPGVAGTCQVHL